MDNININRESIRVRSLMNEVFAELPIDADITLPDYYQDIVRILRCSISPHINSVSVSGEHVTADGVAYVKILYAGEAQNIYCYEMSYPFSKSVDISGLAEDCRVLTAVRVETCSCRAVSGRRFDVHAALRVCFSVVRLKEMGALNNVEGGGVELQKKENRLLDNVNVSEKMFTLEENVRLPDNQPGALRVLRCEGNPVVNEIKVIPNKLMLKGEAAVELLYVPEDGGTELVHGHFSVGFNEILEVPGLEENHICDVRLMANAVDADIAANGGDDARSLSLTLRMSARINVSQVRTVTTATDSFSTIYDLNLEHARVDRVKQHTAVDENYICKGALDLSDVTPEKILDVSVVSVGANASLEGQTAVLGGGIALGVLYATGDGNLGYREKNLNLHYEKDCGEAGGKLVFDPALSVIALTHTLADNRLDVKVELLVKGSLFLLEDDTVLTSVRILEETKREREPGGLVIYYADRQEKLWDIARRYNISPETLRTENHLAADVLEESCMLLIPCI